MIKGSSVRKLLKETGNGFASKVYELLGIELKENEFGERPARFDKNKAQISPDEFSIRDLTEEFLGTSTVRHSFNPKGGSAVLREALNPSTASQFQDVNAYNQLVGGLLSVKLLEGYQQPKYIADEWFERQDSPTNGGKMIGLPHLQLSDGFVQEGKEFPAAGMQERWVIAQKCQKKGRQLSLTKETVHFNLTPDLLNTAYSIGDSLAYEREYWMAATAMGIDIVAGTPGFMAGIVDNTYIYCGQPNDTPNATYQTTAGTGASLKYNYINKLASNPLSTYASFQSVQKLLNLMREPETSLPILAELKDVVVSPNAEYNARAVVHSTQVLQTAGSSGLSGSAGYGTFTQNPIPTVNLKSSTIWNKVLVDSGISQANSDVYWFAGDMRKSFVWREAWKLDVVQSNPAVPEQLSRDIVNAWFASWFGVPVVRDPHYTILSTN